jgi:macrolide-specific efflux system membrane fusion protein
MTANIKLITKKKDNVLLLPEAAITPTATGERQVMIPGEKGKPVPQIVQVGLENGEQAEIISGVQEGDTVLVIRNRYTPQQAAATSPLVAGGPTQGRGQGGGRGGNR